MGEVPMLPPAVDVASRRLVLREWEADDAEALGAAISASIEHLRPWMAWIAEEPVTLDARRARIAQWADERRQGGGAAYGIWRVDGTEPVVAGSTGLHRRAEGRPDILEIGYWVHVDHARQGIATEVTAALTTAAFSVPGTTEVVIHHDPANVASGAVPAKLGYRRRADEPCPVPGGPAASTTWHIDAPTWANRSR